MTLACGLMGPLEGAFCNACIADLFSLIKRRCGLYHSRDFIILTPLLVMKYRDRSLVIQVDQNGLGPWYKGDVFLNDLNCKQYSIEPIGFKFCKFFISYPILWLN